MFEPWVLVAIGLLGLVAGVLGGMLGIGGSTIMIPALVVLFGQGEALPGLAGRFEGLNQHVYQAAAMIVNVCVSIPATWRHVQAGAVVPAVLWIMLPAGVVAILLGVSVSDAPMFHAAGNGAAGPVLLGRIMAVFLLYVIVVNIRRMFRKPRPIDAPLDLSRVTLPRGTAVGGGMGFIAGLLGIGGGGIAVPLQQVLLKLRLRNCIANSAAAICLMSAIGAAYKNSTLASHGLSPLDSGLIAVLLAPTAIIGGYIGGRLTHVLPVRVVRGAFIVLMAAAAWKMAALPI